MMDKPKCFSTAIFFAMVTLCLSSVSSYFILPRVTRTSDAIIIDYTGVGYAPFVQGRGYGEIVHPGFIPVSSFHPYGMVQQQPMFYNGWSYFSKQATPAPTCGKGPAALPTRSLSTERIVGASSNDVTEAKKNAWPFLVVLKKSTDPDGAYICSGSLITDSKVLFAAQCLEKMSVFEISKVTVLVGVASKTEIQMTRRISKVVLHSQYNAVTYANDVAILTLDMPVVLSKTVGTVCLPAASTDPDHFADQDAAMIGWGMAASGSDAITPSNSLKQGKVSIVANADCKSISAISKYVTDSNTCVTSERVFTCAPDVGGPVVVITSAPNVTPVTWTQVAINSYTKSSCDAVGLKTRVSAFSDWIKTYSV